MTAATDSDGVRPAPTDRFLAAGSGRGAFAPLAAIVLATLFAALMSTLVAGCASLPDPGPRPVSRAFDRPETTPLGRAAMAGAPAAAVSGFQLIETGADAYDARLRLAREARVSLDLQYFIVRDDDATHALLGAVREAAERGVRVRLLVDDLHTTGQDRDLAAWADHPNIALRLFNPLAGDRGIALTRWIAGLGDFERVNRRMHNKLFVADSAVAVAGGRNLGAEYFLRSPTQNFADLDVVAAGPVVKRLAAVFDQFWNSPNSYPLKSLSPRTEALPDASGGPFTPPAPSTPPAVSPSQSASPPSGPAPTQASLPTPPRPRGPASALTTLLGANGDLTWAPARLLADAPDKALVTDSDGRPAAAGESATGPSVVDSLDALMRAARRDVLLVSPYLIPGEDGLETFRALRARGVRVRLLTNSLATTDAALVHAAWARYRPVLLALGVEVHELRAQPGRPRGLLKAFGSSRASLHAKALVIDGERSLIGSVNLDPRSARLNTELGLLIESPALTRRLTALIEDDLSPDNTYRVVLQADGSLRWSSTDRNGERTDATDPDTTLWLRAFTYGLGRLVPESQL